MQGNVVLERHTFIDSFVCKSPVAVVVVKKVVISDPFCHCTAVRDKEIEKAIVIVIAPDGCPGVRRVREPSLGCYIGKGTVPIIAIECIGRVSGITLKPSGDIKVEQAIIVIVAPRDTMAVCQRLYTSGRRDVTESPISVVTI